MEPVLIIGAGVGGLTLALQLHARDIPCRVFEAAPDIAPLGVGINVLPHAMAELGRLGVAERLEAVAVTTRESAFFNRFGQLIHREPAGRFAGHPWPQLSIHRGVLQGALLDAVRERLGADAVATGWRCTGVEQDETGATAHFVAAPSQEPLPTQRGAVAVGCDGIHSAVRRQLHPDEGPPRYSGVNMWRGVTVHPPFLTGASMVRAGWLTTGKLVVYPIRDAVGDQGRQLVNWVAEVETPSHLRRDWNRQGRLEDVLPHFADWHFDWLDVPALMSAAEQVLEYPMVDQDPLPHWTVGRVTLLGDAAHPMVPRGSNGAGQAVLDTRALADRLAEHADPAVALKAYEAERLPATSQVVLANRSDPPDAILREVYLRTGDKPFDDIDEVISPTELSAITAGYRAVADQRL